MKKLGFMVPMHIYVETCFAVASKRLGLSLNDIEYNLLPQPQSHRRGTAS